MRQSSEVMHGWHMASNPHDIHALLHTHTRVHTHVDPAVTMAHDQAKWIDNDVLAAVGKHCQDLAEIRIINCTQVPS